MPISGQYLRTLKIIQLKGLRNFEIDFTPKNLTAILGVNGCGKSTILHALSCIYKPLDETSTINYKFSHFFIPTTHSIWSGSQFSIFHDYRDGVNFHSNIETEFSKQADRWAPKYDKRISRHVSFIGIRTTVPIVELETQNTVIKYQTTPMNDDLSNIAREKASIVMNRDYEQYYLNTTTKNKSYIGVRYNNIDYSSLSMGAGEQRIFFILREIYKAPKNSLILIDEIDLLLHADALKRLLIIINERAIDKNIQVIFTTHNHTILDLSNIINIRHIFQTPIKTFCFNDTKPDAISRLTGEKIRPLEIFVEDDLSKTIVKKVCGELRISKYVDIKEFGAAINCFTAVAGVILNSECNLDNMLFVIDGDLYKTNEEKKERIGKVLTGTTREFQQKRDYGLSLIRQFNLPNDQKPEEFLHNIICNLPHQQNEEFNEIINVARQIKAVDNAHMFADGIISRMDYERNVGLSKIIDIVSLSPEWIAFKQPIVDWLQQKRVILEESLVT
jgi:AAA15 family ATPase/GTPase